MHGPFSGTINDVKRTDIKICKKIKNGKSVDKLERRGCLFPDSPFF